MMRWPFSSLLPGSGSLFFSVSDSGLYSLVLLLSACVILGKSGFSKLFLPLQQKGRDGGEELLLSYVPF